METFLVREEDYLVRRIWLKELGENELEFRAEAEHLENGTMASVSGNAISTQKGTELREDDSGEAHPVREYWFEQGEYRICIAVEIREKDLVWILEDGPSPHPPGCRLGGEGPMMPEVAG